ncbi:unnamed protein product [Discosporangium mesarthrocarpum]
MGQGQGQKCRRRPPLSPRFIPPRDDVLCPVPSGPMEGVVLLGLDCEMILTTNGMELARTTIVNMFGGIVYDMLVKPSGKVVSYNTPFSGITEDQLRKVTRTLPDVQRELLSFITLDTYLVGHSLDSDLKALRLVHRKLIDTSNLFPHPRHSPFRMGLKKLCKLFLGREIQENERGHDSVEDASTAVELALLKMYMGEEYGLPRAWAANTVPARETIFDQLRRSGLRPFRCTVVGDHLAQASGHHPLGSRIWTRSHLGYSREEDAVWCARQPPSEGVDTPERPAGPVFVQAVACTTALSMLHKAFDCLGPKPPSTPSCPPAGTFFIAQETPASGADAKAMNASPSPLTGLEAEVGGRSAVVPQAGERTGLQMVESEGKHNMPDFLWVGFPCTGSPFDVQGASAFKDGPEAEGGKRQWRTLHEIDVSVSELHARLPPGTLLVVVCQGSVPTVVELLGKKTRAKWDARADQNGELNAGGGSSVGVFNHRDENDLEVATDEALNGMCFLAVT